MPLIPLVIAILALATAFVWARGIWRWGAAAVGRAKAVALPRISVIVAARNEERFVGKSVQSLLALDYPRDLLEICVVDDHSDDKTIHIVVQAAQQDSRLRVVIAPEALRHLGPKKQALAAGIGATHGELLLFTDADCEVPPGWARALVREFTPETGAVASAVLPAAGSGLGARLYRIERLLVNYTAASAIGWGIPGTVNGGSFAYRRSVYEAMGGHAHPELASGDDDLMAQAIAAAGWHVRFAHGPESLVTDLRPPELRRQLQASARHQSTVRYYPLVWRMLYILTITSGIGLGALAVAGSFDPRLWILVLGAITARAIVEGAAVRLFAKRVGSKLPVWDFLLGELILPFYLLVRPLLALQRNFAWHERTYPRTVERPAS